MASVPTGLAGCNYPIETEIQVKFWSSNHKCNRAKAIIAFSYDKENAMRNMKRLLHWRHFFRHRAWNAFGQYVNTPSMAGIPFSEMSDFYWKCMPNDISDGGDVPPTPTPPTITITSPDTDMIVGNTYPLIATVTGNPTPTVVWTANGTNIGTGDSIVFTPTEEKDYVFVATATNSEGSASDTQTRTAAIPAKPSLTWINELSNVTVEVGTPLELTVLAESGDSSPITYEWQDGSTGTTFTVDTSVEGDINVSCVATGTDTEPATINTNAVITVTAAVITPIIEVQPSDWHGFFPDTAVFSAVATPGTWDTVQWQYLSTAPASVWTNITHPSAQTETLDTGWAILPFWNGYKVRAVYTKGAIDVATDSAEIILPDIELMINQTVGTNPAEEGSAVEIKVTPTNTGSEPFDYEWFKDGVAVPTIVGDTLSTSNVLPSDAGTYTVAIKLLEPDVISDPYTLEVIPKPTTNKTFGVKVDKADASSSGGFVVSQPWCYDGPQLSTSVGAPNNLADTDGWLTAIGGEKVISLSCMGLDSTSKPRLALYEAIQSKVVGEEYEVARKLISTATPPALEITEDFGTAEYVLDTPITLEANKKYCVAFMDETNESFAVVNMTDCGSKWNVTSVANTFDVKQEGYDSPIDKNEAPITWATYEPVDGPAPFRVTVPEVNSNWVYSDVAEYQMFFRMDDVEPSIVIAGTAKPKMESIEGATGEQSIYSLAHPGEITDEGGGLYSCYWHDGNGSWFAGFDDVTIRLKWSNAEDTEDRLTDKVSIDYTYSFDSGILEI